MPACYLFTGLLSGAFAAVWSVWLGQTALFSLFAASICGSFCLLGQAFLVACTRADDQFD
jgi:hypothetical protein